MAVKGSVYHQYGRNVSRERRLTLEDLDNAVLVATVSVKDDGSVELSGRWRPEPLSVVPFASVVSVHTDPVQVIEGMRLNMLILT